MRYSLLSSAYKRQHSRSSDRTASMFASPKTNSLSFAFQRRSSLCSCSNVYQQSAWIYIIWSGVLGGGGRSRSAVQLSLALKSFSDSSLRSSDSRIHNRVSESSTASLVAQLPSNQIHDFFTFFHDRVKNVFPPRLHFIPA